MKHMNSTNLTINGDIQAQLIGKTVEHLHFFNDNLAIHKQMLKSFNDLTAAAKQQGLSLKIASGYRSFERQLQIWNNKYLGKTPILDKHNQAINIEALTPYQIVKAIMLYSALPGASRHHWGCDIDVYADNLLEDGYHLKLEPWEYQAGGPLAALSSWLKINASSYGFYFPYDSYRGGVAAEPWHISFLPLATQYQKNINLAQLCACLENSNIAGKRVIIDNIEEITNTFIFNVNNLE